MLIKPNLHGLICTDIEGQISDWAPSDPEDVYYYLQMDIGCGAGGGADCFGLTVVTPQALKKHPNRQKLKRHVLVIKNYSWEAVFAYIHEVLDKCQGHEWTDVTHELAKYFYWEFEDYVQR